MAITVPRYEGPTVGIAPVSNPQATPLGADAFGAGLAKGLQQVSSEMFAIAKEEHIKEEATALKKAKLDALSGMSSVIDGQSQPDGTVTPGLITLEGTQAQGLEQQYRPKHEEIILKAKENLKQFPAANQLFDEWSQEKYIEHATNLNKRELKERQRDALATNDALAKTAADTMLRAYSNGEAVDVFDPKGDLEKSVRDSAQLQGWSDEQTQRRLAEERSNLLAAMIKSSLAEKDLASAKQLYADFGEFIGTHNQPVVDALHGQIKEEENWQVSEAKAQEVFTSLKPTKADQPLDLEAMRAKIAQDSSLDHDQKKLAESKVEEYGREYHAQQKAVEEGFVNKINAGFQQKQSYVDLKRQIDNADISSTAKGHIYDWLDHKFKIGVKDPEVEQAKNLQRLANFMSFQDNYLKGNYGTLTPAQVATKFTGQLGPLTDNAMQFVNNVGKDLGTAKLDHAEFTGLVRIMRENKDYAAVLPNPESKKDTDQAKMALLTQKVTEIMAAGKDAPGKKVSMKEATLKAIESVTTDKGIFTNTTEPIYLLGSDMSSKYGKNPAKWPVDSQNRYISEQFYANPKNKGKFLSFELMDKYRQALTGGK